ncbi:MAG: flagellar hook-associated protein FlgK [Deltaproteobacteria bacterium]|nr:flagellar hook-associated protein FlgK [Deltaproteobacteria bacterium]
MGGLLSSLDIARSGLAASQAGVQQTSQNISNANTEGYHRRSLVTSPLGPRPGLGGVSVDGVLRSSDRLLARQLSLSLGAQGFADARQTLLLHLDRTVGQLGEGGVQQGLSTLFNAFSGLASAPENLAARQQVLSAAGDLARTFNSKAEALDQTARSADEELLGLAKQATDMAAQVAKLNVQITQTEATGADASDLRDQQDKLVGQLNQLTGATSFLDGQGQTTVLIDGMVLVQGNRSASLQGTPDATLNGRQRLDLVDGATRMAMTSRLGGRMGGLVAVRDTTIPGLQSQLDQLAYDVATAVNTQHRAGYGLDGANGRDLFTPPTGVTGAATALSVNATLTANQVAASSSATALPGNNQNALALSALAQANLAGGGSATAAGQWARVVGQLGADAQAAVRTADVRLDELTHLQTLQMSREGVSLDEEMIHLVEYQRSYQASTKVLQVVDSLLDELMRI